MILYSVSAHAVQIVGVSQGQAGVLTAVLNLGTGVGRPVAGVVSDRFGRVWVAAWITLGCGGAVFGIWIPADSFAVLVGFALIAGAILGGEWKDWKSTGFAEWRLMWFLRSVLDVRRPPLRRSRRVEGSALFPLAAVADGRAAYYFLGSYSAVSASA